MRYLLDTCVISEFTKADKSGSVLEFLSEKNENDLFISTMTLGELHRGIMKLPNGKKQAGLLQWLAALEDSFQGRLLGFDHEAAIEWAKLCTTAEQKGKKLSAFDSIIAAIASRNYLVLVTRNIKDFEHTDLEVINPW